MTASFQATPRLGFGPAWLLLCIGFALHVWDEATHHFLEAYNASILAMADRYWWFPKVVWQYREWLVGLLVGIIVCFALTPFAFRGSRWLRPLAYLFATIHFFNGMGHILATVFGRTVSTVQFKGVAPGFYTAPLLLLASSYLFWSLRQTRGLSAGPNPTGTSLAP